MSEALEKLLAQEPIKEPAKRWQNWYRVILPLVVEDDGHELPVGYEYAAPRIYLSKEVAETSAAEGDAEEIFDCGELRHKYLGAFPEGERP